MRRTSPRRVALLAVLLGALVLVACTPEPPAPPPEPPTPPPELPAPPPLLTTAPANSPGLTETVVLDDLTSQIWDLAFTPDGTMVMSLRETGVAVYKEGDAAFDTGPEGAPQPRVIRPVADLWIDGPESGSLGIEVDPDFATNRFVYLCYTSTTPTAKVRVVRYTVDANFTALTDDLELVPGGIDTGQPPGGFHHGCRVKFQPGSAPPALFVTVGEGGIGTAPQDLNSGAGKVLRMTSLGQPYPGNPFGSTDSWGFAGLVYTYGHRNPQGIGFAPDGRVYTAEHGPSVDDEVNLLAIGGNAGWDPVPGFNQGVPMTDLAKFPDALQPVWRSGSPTLAPSGMTILSNAAWSGWQGAALVTYLKGRQALVMLRGADGGVTGTWKVEVGQQSQSEFGRFPRLRTAVEDPAGNLWIPTDHPYNNPLVPVAWHDGRPGQLIKVTPTP